jgi:ParB family chromosome partitioning protein
MGHARAADPGARAGHQAGQEAADEGWSVREVERRAGIRRRPVPSNRPPAAPKVPQADIAALETELSESLGAKVAIAHGRGGKGKLMIHYTDLDTLDGVLERLRRKAGG